MPNAEVIALYGVVIAVLWAALTYFLKRTMSKVDEHDKDINHIKQTYVEKADMEKMSTKLSQDISNISADISGMKDTFITRDDFYRSQSDLKKDVAKIYDYLLKKDGGN